MVTVEFYFDPACPFAWAASRWLVDVASRRDIDIQWRQMSLAVLNEDSSSTASEKQIRHLRDSEQLGRVLAAANRSADNQTFGAVYAVLGHHVHELGSDVTEESVTRALADSELDTQWTAAMTTTDYDDEVRAAHQLSQDKLGDTGGSPIVGIDGAHFFGPVLTAIPDSAEADELFGALLALSRAGTFAQLQRPHSGPPSFVNH